MKKLLVALIFVTAIQTTFCSQNKKELLSKMAQLEKQILARKQNIFVVSQAINGPHKGKFSVQRINETTIPYSYFDTKAKAQAECDKKNLQPH